METAATVRRLERVPPASYFVGSAVFHYLGPAFAVLLLALVEPLGVAWLRNASAALVFALWRRPWRDAGCLGTRRRATRRTCSPGGTWWRWKPASAGRKTYRVCSHRRASPR